MTRPLAYYLDKLDHDGLPRILRRGASRYWSKIWTPLSRQTAGWIIERLGDRIRIEGATFATNSPLIPRFEKGEMVFRGYEFDERRMLKRWLRTDLPLVELGGGIGVTACLANRKLARPHDHVVVEANPFNVSLVERNRDLNGCRFRVIHKALAYGAETVAFGIHPRLVGSSRIGGEGTTIEVATTSLEAVAAAAGFDEISLICDVEGGEAEVVERELDTLRHRVRVLLVEIHPHIIGEEAASRIVQTLETSGFALRDHFGFNWAFTRD